MPPDSNAGQQFNLSYTFEGLSEGINALAISPDGDNLLSGCKLIITNTNFKWLTRTAYTQAMMVS